MTVIDIYPQLLFRTVLPLKKITVQKLISFTDRLLMPSINFLIEAM